MEQLPSKTRTTIRRARASIKQNFVLETLRREIVSGRYRPGSRLPVQTELAAQFQVSGVTMQLAMRRLAEEGFIISRRRVGMVVAPKLPHLQNIGLVLPHDPALASHFSRYYSVLETAARGIGQESDRNVRAFHGIDFHGDTDDRQRLEAQVRGHQLAGLIFASAPFMLEGSAILDEPGLPRVALMTKQQYGHVPVVTHDMESFFARALDYVLAHGRRRVAVVAPPGSETVMGEPGFAELFTQRGLACPPHWWQIVNQATPQGARNAVRLLLQGPPASRPDALLVTDDNLVDQAQAGLVAERIRVPDEVVVVVHRNFPWPNSAILPVRPLGFDCRRVLRHCIDLIDRQRRGEQVPGLTRVPAVFDDELAGSG